MSADKRIEYTAEQRKIIEERGRNMLVTASAGSGKTTAMIERIAALVADGVPVGRILALTFTRAAAEEMRAKLYEKLYKLSEERNDPFIRGQLSAFAFCPAGTVHGFCAELLRAEFTRAGVDPAFGVLDDADAAKLLDGSVGEAADKLFESDPDAFYVLTDTLGRKRSDKRLMSTVKRIITRAVAAPDPEKKLSGAAEFYSPAAVKKAEDLINSRYAAAAEFYARKLREAAALCEAAKNPAYAGALYAMASELDEIKRTESFGANYRRILNFIPPRLPAVKGKDEYSAERAKAVKSDAVDVFRAFSEFFGGVPYDELLRQTEAAAPLAQSLSALALSALKIYGGKKESLRVLDFSDLEHKTRALLLGGAAREEIAARYDYIFIDEYQDINALQEEILACLSGANNRFMVGDVKQSIYAFRMGDPDIINDKAKEYKKSAGLTALNRNFRSLSPVLDFVNAVFDVLMTGNFGGADYAATERLTYGEKYTEKAGEPCVDIEIIDSPFFYGEPPVRRAGIYDVRTAELKGERFSDADAEAVVIAEKIKEYKARGYAYSDMVILTRSQTEYAHAVYKKLLALNVPVFYPSDKSPESAAQFDAPLDLMRAVDNPYRDIPLAASLKRLYGFSDSDLAEIQTAYHAPTEKTDFFTRLLAFKDKKGKIAEAVREFLADFERYRLLSLSGTAFALYREIIEDKGALLSDDPDALNPLYAYAARLKEKENSYAASTASFAAHIDLYGAENPGAGSGGGGAVAMQTAHAAKGLEYPVVFAAALSSAPQKDESEVAVDKEFGIGLNYYDPVTRTKNPTLIKCAARAKSEKKNKEEALRLFYVALTRAKKQLCLVGCADGRDLPDGSAPPPAEYEVAQAGSFMDLLLLALPHTGVKYVIHNKEELARRPQTLEARITFTPPRPQFTYPYPDAVKIKYKTSATEVGKRANAGGGRGAREIKRVNADGAGSIEIGNLYHAILCNIDLSCTSEAAARGEIKRMAAAGLIEEKDADKADTGLIVKILNSELLREAAAVPHFREQPFMTFYPSGAGAGAADEIVVQGVIDLLYESGEGYIIVDYKYSGLKSADLADTYRGQLNVYAYAAERVTGKKVLKKYLFNIKTAEITEVS